MKSNQNLKIYFQTNKYYQQKYFQAIKQSSKRTFPHLPVRKFNILSLYLRKQGKIELFPRWKPENVFAILRNIAKRAVKNLETQCQFLKDHRQFPLDFKNVASS